jgi:hypothetical protein
VRASALQAQAKRAAQRRTWVALARDHQPDVTVRFILAQPPAGSDPRAAAALLRDEIQQYADVVIVPGQESYRHLPSKTLNLFKYAVDSPCRQARGRAS